LPASLRCLYSCEKKPTTNFNRKKMLTEIRENAIKLPDKKERVEFVPGTIRGKKVGVDWDVLNRSKII
jgi:hypothetical protein